jgi:serine/threonine protein kinase/WD40 repeat protein
MLAEFLATAVAGAPILANSRPHTSSGHAEDNVNPGILRRLAQDAPTPLARLAERAQNDSSSIRQHHNTYYVFEMWLRLMGAIAVARYRRTKQDLPTLEEGLGPLTQPTVGGVLAFIETYARAFTGDAIARLLRAPLEPEMLPGYRWSCAHGGRSVHREPTIGEFARALAAYRNKSIGHGAVNPPEFYREGAAALFGSVGSLVINATSVITGRLLAVDDVSEKSDGTRAGIVLELAGSLRTRLPESFDEGMLPDMRPSSIYFETEGQTPLALFPWVIWEDDFVQVLSSATKSKVDYLNYHTGKLSSHQTPHVAALRACLQAQSHGLPERPQRGKRPGHWIGDYEILGVLGHGGMGTVYRARQDSTDMPVALKVLPEALVDDPVALARFQREAHLLTRREHPNLVSILDAGEAGGIHYFAMELISGCSLAEVYAVLSKISAPRKADLTRGHLRDTIAAVAAERAEPVSSRRAVRPIDSEKLATAVVIKEGTGEELWKTLVLRFAEVADGLAYLHGRGIIHRDIKPSNIMLTEDATCAVVTDLGIARIQTGTVHTRTGTFVGTLRYASREQALRSIEETTHLSDLYSLGATMYELLTLTPLFASDEVTASSMAEGVLLRKILDERPAPATVRNAALRPEVAIILEKLLEKQPERRFYSSAADLATDLRNIYHQRPISARDYTADERRAFELFDSLRAQARTWDAERRPADLLWSEERYAELVAREVRERFELTALEVEFYEATAAHAFSMRSLREQREEKDREVAEELQAKRVETERLRTWVRRGALVGLFAALVASTLGAWFKASVSRQQAEESRRDKEKADEARQGAVDREAQVLLLKAQEAGRNLRWDEALLFATEAGRLELKPELAAEARAILAQEALVGLRTRRLLSGNFGPTIRALAISSTDRWLAVLSDKLTVLSLQSHVGVVEDEKRELDSTAFAKKPTSIAFAPDAPFLAVGLDDGTVELWDVPRWRRQAQSSTAASAVRTLAFAASGRQLLAGGEHGLRVLSVDESGALSEPKPGSTAASSEVNILGVSLDGRFAVSTTDGAGLDVLKGPSWIPANRLSETIGDVYAAAFSSAYLVSGGADGEVRAWPLPQAGGDRIGASGVVCKHNKEIYAIATARDGAIVASGGEGNEVHLSDASLQRDVRVLGHLPDQVMAIGIDPSGGTLAIGLEDGTVDIRDVERLQEVGASPFLGHTSAVENLALWGDALVSSGDDDQVMVWDLSRGTHAEPFTRPGVRSALAAAGHTMATGARDGTVLLRRLNGDQSVLRTGAKKIACLAVAPDESAVAFGTDTGMIGICPLQPRSRCRLWRGHFGKVNNLRFAPKGASLASVGDVPGVAIWPLDEPRPDDVQEAALQGAEASNDVAFAPGGSLIATAQLDGRVLVWDPRSRLQVKNLDPPGDQGDRAWAVAFSPDGRYLASATKKGQIRVWETLTWRRTHDITGHLDAVFALLFTGDGQRLISAGEDGTIRLWDTSTWTESGAHGSRFDGDASVVAARVNQETGLRLVLGEPRYSR